MQMCPWQFEGGMSETFQSTLGVKQGCPLSPTLFGIYIDDFQAELETAGGDLDLPTLCGVQAPALFYADDLDLVSTSVRGLQAQLELLESFCTGGGSPSMSRRPRWWCMLHRLLHHRFLLTCVLQSKCWTRLHIWGLTSLAVVLLLPLASAERPPGTARRCSHTNHHRLRHNCLPP